MKIVCASSITDSIEWGPVGRASSRRVGMVDGGAREMIGFEERLACSSLKREAMIGSALRTS